MRLRPHTDRTPKPLLPWRGKPSLDWVLDSLQSAGVSRVVVVTGHLEEQVRAYAKTREQKKPEQQICCVTQTTLDGTAGAVSCALAERQEWFNESFMVSATDYLVPDNYYPDLLRFHAEHSASISISLKTVPTEELGSRSSVAYRGDFDITEVVEKPEAGQAPSEYSANLIYIIPTGLQKSIQQVGPSPRGEREIQTAINAYLASGGTAKGLLQPVPQEWVPEMAQ